METELLSLSTFTAAAPQSRRAEESVSATNGAFTRSGEWVAHMVLVFFVLFTFAENFLHYEITLPQNWIDTLVSILGFNTLHSPFSFFMLYNLPAFREAFQIERSNPWKNSITTDLISRLLKNV